MPGSLEKTISSSSPLKSLLGLRRRSRRAAVILEPLPSEEETSNLSFLLPPNETNR